MIRNHLGRMLTPGPMTQLKERLEIFEYKKTCYLLSIFDLKSSGTLLPFAELLIICVSYNLTSRISCCFFLCILLVVVGVSSNLGNDKLATNI